MTCDSVRLLQTHSCRSEYSIRRTHADYSRFWHFLQERPCTRCIKRNIGHLCHDEPRETTTKKSKTESDPTGADEAISPKKEFPGTSSLPNPSLQDNASRSLLHDSNIGLRSPTADQLSGAAQGTNAQRSTLNGGNQLCKTLEIAIPSKGG